MKKIIFLLLLISSVFLLSCEKDNEEDTNQKAEVQETKVDPKTYGVWVGDVNIEIKPSGTRYCMLRQYSQRICEHATIYYEKGTEEVFEGWIEDGKKQSVDGVITFYNLQGENKLIVTDAFDNVLYELEKSNSSFSCPDYNELYQSGTCR